MKTMKIYEPAMCCPTGLCGVGVDPELLRISTVLNTLKQYGIEVQRFNLTSAPEEFVKSKAVTEYLQKFGPDKLPVATVEDMIVIAGRYPTNEEFTSWLELSGDVLGVSCCEDDASCCCLYSVFSPYSSPHVLNSRIRQTAQNVRHQISYDDHYRR